MASHVNVGISPKADIELAETLLELLRSGHRLSKRQLTTVAIHRFVQEVREALQGGDDEQLLHLLGQEIDDDKPQALAA